MRKSFAAALAAVSLATGCAPAGTARGTHRILVVATTSLIASLVSSVAGGDADVRTLVPVGASPETFEPRPADVAAVSDADVVVLNGAGLEGWIDGLLRSTRRSAARVVRCADGLPVVNGNPHLWLNPLYARRYVAAIRDALVASDPAHRDGYTARAAAFDGELASLDRRIRASIGTLPAERRRMLVFHDAWRYYDARYGIATVGVIQETPGREPSAAHLAALTDAARSQHLHTIFAEPQFDPKIARVLAQSAGIANVAVLYDDSVGTSAQTKDYVAMLETDTATIVAGMR